MTNDQLVGLKEFSLQWAVIEGTDVTYFRDDAEDADDSARGAAEEYAALTGGRVVRLGIRSEIVHVEELLDGFDDSSNVIDGELIETAPVPDASGIMDALSAIEAGGGISLDDEN